MARDVVTAIKLAVDGDQAEPAGTAITVANGARVIPGKLRKTVIICTNTSASPRVVTVRRSTVVSDPVPGDYSSAPIAATTGIQVMGPLSGKYLQSDGSFWLDFAAGHVGVVKAVELP